MYETRHYITQYDSNDDSGLAQGYRELTELYKLYQQAALTMDRRFVPQIWLKTNPGTGVQEKQYAFPQLERLFDEREKELEKREAIPAGTAVERDESETTLRELRATLEIQRQNAKEELKDQWLAFEKICKAIADNEYVKQFYHQPLFIYLAESVSRGNRVGTVFYPTQESRLTQYKVNDGIVYYNGKRYTLGDDWNAKRAQIFDKLISFENPFP